MLFQFLIVLKHVYGLVNFRLRSGSGGSDRYLGSGFYQAAVLIAFEQKSEQGVLRTVLLQYIAGSVNGVARQFRHSHLFYLRASAKHFFQILQVGGSTCEDDAGQQFVFVAGDLNLVPYVSDDFLGTCLDDVVELAQFDCAAFIFELAGGGLFAFVFFV